MQDDLPEDLRAALRAAGAAARPRGRKAAPGGAPRLTLRVGAARYPVLRLWSGGLAVPAEAGARLRGRVDVYDGARHLFHCLIVASQEDGDEVLCDFKHATPAAEAPPADYAPGEGDFAPARATPDPA